MLGVDDLPEAPRPDRRYPAPVCARRALAVIRMLRLPTASRVLDLAAGSGGLLLDAMAVSEGRGLGLVAGEADAALARAAAEREGLAERVEFRVATPDSFVAGERYDAILFVLQAPSAEGAPELVAAR